MTLVFTEVEDGVPVEASLVAITVARTSGPIEAVVCEPVDPAALGAYGVTRIHRVTTDGYAPRSWGEAVSHVARDTGARLVVASATVRGNEVLAHAAVDLDAPFAANCLALDGADVRRIRWGGSLFEESTVEGDVIVVSFSPFAAETTPSASPTNPEIVETPVSFSPEASIVRIIDEEQAAEGLTLATARLVVSGGRGVGSAEGFAVLEELAGLLGGKVGCSRVVTNNGWRPHSDQVGQTGTVVAPDLYIGCGISGAIQHWVGMMASKQVLAINTDREAPMVTKADFAVIGDLHEVLPAIVAELRARQTKG